MRTTTRLDEGTARQLKQEFQATARVPAQASAQPPPASPRVWIIYPRKDEKIARDLVARLRADGISAAWDRDLPPGVDYDLYIEDSIRNCDSAVAIWSPSALASRFVLDEATLALELNKLIPVHTPDFDPTTLTMRFRRLQSTCIQDYAKLLATLRGGATLEKA